jgi:DNA-binding transcriptional LysR family regulator
VPAALIAAAVVSLGLQEKVLTAAQGAAIITAALASLGIAALGTTLLAREARQAGDNAGTPPGRDGEGASWVRARRRSAKMCE